MFFKKRDVNYTNPNLIFVCLKMSMKEKRGYVFYKSFAVSEWRI
jgi:hypothetical protein